MARRRVIARAYEQPAVTARDASGFPTAFHPTKLVWAPALYKYCGAFTVKEDRAQTAWTLCLVDDGALIHADADADPDVKALPTGITLNTALTGARLTGARAWINRTDWGITITDGMTVRQALQAIQSAIRNTDVDTSSEVE